MKQRIFLSITAGPTPRDVEPVVCTEDRSVIEAALAAIERRLGSGEPPPAAFKPPAPAEEE